MMGQNLYCIVLPWLLMLLSEVFLGLGEETFHGLLRSVSMGKLKTFQLFDRFKTRAHLAKLNSESLRKAGTRLWSRMGEKDEDFATDVAQAVLVSHMDLIQRVLDFLEVPHEDGFFAKDADISSHLTDGWEKRVFDQFQDTFSKDTLLFYINHLAWETGRLTEIFRPAA